MKHPKNRMIEKEFQFHRTIDCLIDEIRTNYLPIRIVTIGPIFFRGKSANAKNLKQQQLEKRNNQQLFKGITYKRMLKPWALLKEKKNAVHRWTKFMRLLKILQC